LNGLLLDTHTAIWLASGIQLSQQIVDAIKLAGLADGVFISPISAWEIGLLATHQNATKAIRFEPNPTQWFATLMAHPIIKSAPFDGDIAIAASFMPQWSHRDPADRLLVATARHMDIPIVTRDTEILAYSNAGHVKSLAC
jgi:PIN domain nuclease of toxin-antitoxin system